MSTSRQRSSPGTSVPSKSNGKAAATAAVPPQTPAPLPAADDREGWRSHWQAQGQPWRTEPEIDRKRQAELDQRRAIAPNIEKGMYPFKDMKLTRADVEWLLATHENGRGPVDWSDESQRKRVGLDVRGADLCTIDLSHLPLARLCGGLTWDMWDDATEEQRKTAAVHMERTNLQEAHLEDATLLDAILKGIQCYKTHLEFADLSWSHLEGAYFYKAYLNEANLTGAHVAHAQLSRAQLERADLEDLQFGNENHNAPHLADVEWGNTNLAVVDWSQMKMLGDEYVAYQKKSQGNRKDRKTRLHEFGIAVRATRQFSTILQAQGINEEATRFAYRAQLLQKMMYQFQMLQPGIAFKQRLQTLGAWLFSWFLFLIAGYGYKPGRSFLAYLLVIFGFAIAYYILGHTVGPALSPLGAFVFSMTSFHGRGFFPGNNISLDDPLTVLAALEALVGLIIEVTFIATLTQRFFNR